VLFTNRMHFVGVHWLNLRGVVNCTR